MTGLVIDPSGAPIAGATVRVEQAGGVPATTETGADGTFTLDRRDARRGDGRRRRRPISPRPSVSVTVAADTPALRIVLQPAPLAITVTVTASRGTAVSRRRPRARPSCTSSELLASGGAMVDDVLRNTPGFSLNRRSSSRASPPPSQGVALRGIPGIGASRTMVLADGLPLNDPFGGWVYWDRIPQAAIDRVEVLRGAAGDLYGADAMGGVIQILTFTSGNRRLRAIVEGGTQETVARRSSAAGRPAAGPRPAAGEWENSGGYMRVPPEDRGAVDHADDERLPDGVRHARVQRQRLARAGARAASITRSDRAARRCWSTTRRGTSSRARRPGPWRAARGS